MGEIHKLDKALNSHIVSAVWRLFEPLPLDEVLVDLRVLHARVGGLPPRHDFPHGHTKSPLSVEETKGVHPIKLNIIAPLHGDQ